MNFLKRKLFGWTSARYLEYVVSGVEPCDYPVIHEHARRCADRRVRKWVIYGAILAGISFALIGSVLNISNQWFSAGFGMAIGMGGGASHVPYSRVYEREARRYALTLGYKVCVKCGYDLRGIDENRPCPECGAARESITRGDSGTKVES